MNQDKIISSFRKAIETDAAGRKALLESLQADERQQLEKLLEADEECNENDLFNPLCAGQDPLAGKPCQIRDYQIFEMIGEGGMGQVYRAHHSRLECDVAFKILPEFDSRRRPDLVDRFQKEMAAIGKLRHQNIVQATDAGVEDGLHFLVLELIDGIDVRHLINRTEQISVPDACEIIYQAAAGLQYAHNKELIHRDIKPSNLMVSRNGEVKIADLGLALLVNRESRDSSTGKIMGTLDFISPEQIDSPDSVDERADLYSLGCTFYYLLSGEPPFSEPKYKTTLEKLKGHGQDTPPSLSTFRSDIPEPILRTVEKLMEKNPKDRFQSAKALAREIAAFARGSNLSAIIPIASDGSLALHSTDRIDAEGAVTEVDSVLIQRPYANEKHDSARSSALDLKESEQLGPATSETRGFVLKWMVLGAILLCGLGIWFDWESLVLSVGNKGILLVENCEHVSYELTTSTLEPRVIEIVDGLNKKFTLDAGIGYHMVFKHMHRGVVFHSKRIVLTKGEETVYDVHKNVQEFFAGTVLNWGMEWMVQNAADLKLVTPVSVESATAAGLHPDHFPVTNLIDGSGLTQLVETIGDVPYSSHEFAGANVSWATASLWKEEFKNYFDCEDAPTPKLTFTLDSASTLEGFIYWGFYEESVLLTRGCDPREFKFTCRDATGDPIGEPVVVEVEQPSPGWAHVIDLPTIEGVISIDVEVLSNFAGLIADPEYGNGELFTGERVGLGEVRFLIANE